MRPGLAWLALIALPLSLSLPAVAQETGPIVAVFDIDDRTKALEESAVKDLADYLAVLLTQGGWQVVPRDQLRARLKEAQTDSYKTCVDQSCQVELGRELAAQKTLSTQIFKLGSECRVTATLYDLKRAATEKAESAKSGCEPDKLGLALEELAGRITRKLDQVDLEKARQAEADRKAVEETAAKKKILEEELARQKAIEEKAARQKAAEEEAARQKTAVEDGTQAKAEEAQPVQEGIGDHLAVLGLHLGLLSGGLGSESGVYFEHDRMQGEVQTKVGAFLDLGCDFVLARYFSIGLEVDFQHTYTEQIWSTGPTERGSMDYMGFNLRLKGRLPIADVVELRLGVAAGAGLWLNFPTVEVTDAGANPRTFGVTAGFAGVSLTSQLEAAWWVLPDLGLVLAIGIVAQPTGPLDVPSVPPESGSDYYDISFPPRLTFTLGVEYGL